MSTVSKNMLSQNNDYFYKAGQTGATNTLMADPNEDDFWYAAPGGGRGGGADHSMAGSSAYGGGKRK